MSEDTKPEVNVDQIGSLVRGFLNISDEFYKGFKKVLEDQKLRDRIIEVGSGILTAPSSDGEVKGLVLIRSLVADEQIKQAFSDVLLNMVHSAKNNPDLLDELKEVVQRVMSTITMSSENQAVFVAIGKQIFLDVIEDGALSETFANVITTLFTSQELTNVLNSAMDRLANKIGEQIISEKFVEKFSQAGQKALVSMQDSIHATLDGGFDRLRNVQLVGSINISPKKE